MNRLVRRIAKKIRYRPLLDLISNRVPIHSFDTIVEDTSSWLTRKLSWTVRFQEPQQKYMAFSIVKYGILDLTFVCDGIGWNQKDAAGMAALKECGFVFHLDEVPEDTRMAMADEEDPTCLAELQGDIDKNETLVRLFLERKPGEYLDPGYVKSLVTSGRMKAILEASEAGEEDLRRIVNQDFPADFTVSDACLTNAGFIWFHKHSYL